MNFSVIGLRYRKHVSDWIRRPLIDFATALMSSISGVGILLVKQAFRRSLRPARLDQPAVDRRWNNAKESRVHSTNPALCGSEYTRSGSATSRLIRLG